MNRVKADPRLLVPNENLLVPVAIDGGQHLISESDFSSHAVTGFTTAKKRLSHKTKQPEKYLCSIKWHFQSLKSLNFFPKTRRRSTYRFELNNLIFK